MTQPEARHGLGLVDEWAARLDVLVPAETKGLPAEDIVTLFGPH
jgi:hypothetical protein